MQNKFIKSLLRLSNREIRILLLLIFESVEGRCCISLKDLSIKTGIQVNHITTSLKKLRAKKLIKQKLNNKVNEFILKTRSRRYLCQRV